MEVEHGGIDLEEGGKQERRTQSYPRAGPN